MTERFDTLYSISDLHLGGRPGFQMVSKEGAQRLADAIDVLAARRSGRTVMVLNGDILDTLAEARHETDYVRVDDAVEVVQRILTDPTFKPVFTALTRWVAAPDNHLVFAIGNHDLEVAFPEVQDALIAALGSSPRIRFTPPTHPMLFNVRGKRVYVTHGNEVDTWNVVDADQLAWAIDRKIRGWPFDAANWVPNAGTRLVVSVMNEFKRRHPFVDLLKPEMSVAVPVLAALDPSAFKKVWAAGKSVKQGANTTPRLLGADTPQRPPPADLLESQLRVSLKAGAPTGDSYLDEVERMKARGEAPEAAEGRLEFTWSSVLAAALGDLRTAMRDWVVGDDPFVYDKAAKDDLAIINRINRGIDVVIVGHTHLARSIAAPQRGLVYLNTGTWARLMKVTRADIDDPARWPALEAALRDTSVASLDDGKFAQTIGHVAVVEGNTDGTVTAWLWRPTDGLTYDRAVRGGEAHPVGSGAA